MDIKTSKEKRIRSRYIINEKLFSDVFYTLYDGRDSQESFDVYILKFHSLLVSPQFAEFCIESLQDYLYQRVPNVFQLLDIEYDGQDLFLVYKNENVSLMSLDLYLNKIKKDSGSAEKRYKLLLKIAKIIFQLEEQRLIFGNFSLNNIFISDDHRVILGPAKINLLCLEYFYSKIDVFDACVFIPPEFLKSFKRSIQTDVYSFGVLAYYIVCLNWPYEYKNSIFNLKKAFMKGPKACQDVNSKISDKLNYFIMKSIQFKPEDRWASFRLIIGILEGKETVKFEKLSNKIDPNHSFSSEISEKKQHIFGRFFSIIVNGIAVVGLSILLYVGYQAYFSKYSVVEIPNVEGIALERVKNTLTELQLTLNKVNYNYHPSIAEGQVIRIEPPVGRRIKQGRAVKLFVSKGKQELLVPSLISKTLSEVQFILEGSAIDIEMVDEEFSTTIEKGRVISQMPLPNQYMFDNGKIQIILSKGLPVRIDSLGPLDNDYKKVQISFEFDNEFPEYKFEIYEVINNQQKQQIFSGVFYEDDYFQDEFVINQSSSIEIKLNNNLIYTNQDDEDN
ncbi:MAG: PASTA domain-containing protein [Candidatus Margulisiibacteriota bacterium]